MKNKLFCVFLFLIAFCIIAQAARPQKRSDEAEDDYTAEEQSQSYSSSDFSKAGALYVSGKLDKAELILNGILLSNPDNVEALELKNKILIVKEKFFVFKRDAAEDYMIESERSLRDGNFYEGLLYYKRAVDLMPEIYDAQRYNTIVGELNAQSLKYKGSDRKHFLQSVESFQDGDFKKAKILLDSLSERYEHLKNYKGLMDYFQVEYANDKRVKEYYKEALKDFKQGRYESARVDLEFAKVINSKNSEIALLSEQVDLEIQ
jgi:tetratricopeptide (TPR) repeat protein